jgi:hypothetical protein
MTGVTNFPVRSPKLIRIWATKYALTHGITVHEVEEPSPDSTVRVIGSQPWNIQYFHGEGKEWHRTQKDAMNRAEVMRKAKVASIRKQLAKLESLTISAPP